MKNRLELYDSAQEMLVCELEKLIKNGEVTPSSLTYLDTIVDIIKDLDEITMNEEDRMIDPKMGYSGKNMPSYYGRGTSYRNNADYYRKGYSSNEYMNDRSYGKGNSSEGMLNYLYLAHDNASTEDEKKRIKRMIDEIENK